MKQVLTILLLTALFCITGYTASNKGHLPLSGDGSDCKAKLDSLLAPEDGTYDIWAIDPTIDYSFDDDTFIIPAEWIMIQERVVTDTIIWVSTVDSLNPGDGSCLECLEFTVFGNKMKVCDDSLKLFHSYSLFAETFLDPLIYNHEWVYSEPWFAGSWQTCLVYHNGFHCDLADKIRNRICRKCLRKETQREHWVQHRFVPEKSEYEKLEEKLNISETDSVTVLGVFISDKKQIKEPKLRALYEQTLLLPTVSPGTYIKAE